MNTLHNNKANSNTAKLLEVEKAVADGNLTLAASKNSSILTENSLEESYQMYYEALRHFEENSFTETDSLILMNLVYGCPTLQGPSVSQAATLYNAVYETAEVFENICPEYVEKSQQIIVEENAKKEVYQIFPIPNNGSFFVSGELKADFSIRINDMAGSLVHQTQINEEQKETFIRTNLNSGSYIVFVEDGYGNVLYRCKIVIIR